MASATHWPHLKRPSPVGNGLNTHPSSTSFSDGVSTPVSRGNVLWRFCGNLLGEGSDSVDAASATSSRSLFLALCSSLLRCQPWGKKKWINFIKSCHLDFLTPLPKKEECLIKIIFLTVSNIISFIASYLLWMWKFTITIHIYEKKNSYWILYQYSYSYH